MDDHYLAKFIADDRISMLLSKYFTTGLNEEEQAFLDEWLSYDDNTHWRNNVSKKEELLNNLRRLSEIKQNDEEYLKKLNIKIQSLSQPNLTWSSSNNRFLLIAASIFMCICLTAGWLWFRLADKKAVSTATQYELIGDAEPGKFKARLTFGDGSTIALDTISRGKVADEGTTLVLNVNGKLIYKGNSKESNKNLFNILTTDKGQVYATILSDGTEVWLNSASSLRYPVVFNSKQRTVELTGEAYFEVAPSKTPFVVSVDGMEIQVLGTEFDVNSYNDEPSKKVTLLNGKVQVHSNTRGQQTTLSPGQQAQMSSVGVISTIDNVDVEQSIAWRNGYFQFKKEDFQTVMRQLARWYDLDVVYEGEIPKTYFGGKLPRNVKASVILRILEKNKIHFRIEGKKIIVTP